MTSAQGRGAGRRYAAVALLAGAAAFPLAAAVHPPAEPAAWPLATAVLVAAAAWSGAGRGDATPRPRVHLGALLAVGAAADVVVRAVLRLASGGALDATLMSGATAVVAVAVAGGWFAGGWLAARMRAALDGSLPPGHVQPLARGLLIGGCAAVAAAGWERWGAPAGGWRGVAVAAALVLYAVAALTTAQRLRRTALLSGWDRTGRAVQGLIAQRWGQRVLLLLGGVAAVVSLWWLPALAPLRGAAEQAPRAAVSALLDSADLERTTTWEVGVPPVSEADEDALADVEPTTVWVRRLVEWLREPALTVPVPGEAEDIDGARAARGGITPLQLIVAAAAILVAWLAALAYRRRPQAGDGPRPRALLRAVAAWWQRLRAGLNRLRGRRPEAKGPPHAGAPPAPAGRARGLRRRPSLPREQVKYDYYRVLEHAQRRGLPRRRAQSPAQYARALRPAVPGEASAVEELTAAFVEARYSHHTIDARTAERAREASRTLRRALRGIGR